MKKIRIFKGHSGCKVCLYRKKDKSYFVRKISQSKDYNKRLKKQMMKQKYFLKNLASAKITTPRVIRDGEEGGLFYFDMEYIPGETLINYINKMDSINFEKIAKALIDILTLVRKKKFKGKKTNLASKFHEKIISLQKKIPEEYSPLLDELYKKSSTLPSVEGTFCHGDLTLENIIYSESLGKYYLIDFQDVFTEHYWMDISVLFQDLSEVWFFLMNESLDAKTMKIKMDLLKKKLLILLKKFDSKYFDYHSIFVAMKFFRIIPYAETKNYNYLLMVIQKHLGKFTKKIKPSFFIVSHPRSGGEYLYHLLKQHPMILMSYLSNPNYFCFDFNQEISDFYKRRGLETEDLVIKDEKTYSNLFIGNATNKEIGEFSTHYLYSKVAAKEMKKYAPNAKIIILLRKPSDFLVGLHQERSLKEEPEQDFKTAIKLEKKRKEGLFLNNVLPPRSFVYYTDWIKYSNQVMRYINEFDPKNIKIIFFEDLIKEPLKSYKEVCSFLKINTDFIPEVKKITFFKKIKQKNIRKIILSKPFIHIKEFSKKIIKGALGENLFNEVQKKYLSLMYEIDEESKISQNFKSPLYKLEKNEVKKIEKLLKRNNLLTSNFNLLKFWDYNV